MIEHAVALTALDAKTGKFLATRDVLEGNQTKVKKYLLEDQDQDGITDTDERLFQTDPKNPDTDGDGYLDGAEIQNGYNPLGEGKINLQNIRNLTSGLAQNSQGLILEQGLFEERPLSKNEKTETWYRENELSDAYHEKVVQKKEEEQQKKMAGVLPNSPLYFLKETKDKLILSSAGDTTRKLLARLEIASRKMIEAKVLLSQHKLEEGNLIAQSFQNEIKLIGTEIEQAKLTEIEKNKIKNKLREVLDFHQKKLRDVLADSEVYALKELIYELEVSIAWTAEEKMVKEGEFKKQFAADLLDLSKKSQNYELVNAQILAYKQKFNGQQHGSATLSDAYVDKASTFLVAQIESQKIQEKLAQMKNLEENQVNNTKVDLILACQAGADYKLVSKGDCIDGKRTLVWEKSKTSRCYEKHPDSKKPDSSEVCQSTQGVCMLSEARASAPVRLCLQGKASSVSGE